MTGWRSRGVVVSGSVAACAVVVGGAAFGLALFNGLSSGSQPETVVPSSAFAYAAVDLDPSMRQKLGAFRLFNTFPAAKKAVSESDPAQVVFGAGQQLAEGLGPVDYARDVKPWLGRRGGIALLPPVTAGGAPVTVVALQVKDREVAERSLSTFEGFSGRAGSLSYVFDRDYVVVVPKKAKAAVQSQLSGGRLADHEAFVSDVAALGERGVATAWVNHAGVAQFAGAGLVKKSGLVGHTAGTLRFAADRAEFASVTRGVDLPDEGVATHVSDFPGDTGALLSSVDGGDLVERWWPALKGVVNIPGLPIKEGLQAVSARTGFTVSEFVATLLGGQVDVVAGKEQVDVVLGRQSMRGLFSGGGQIPEVTFRAKTKDPQATLRSVSSTLVKLLGPLGALIPHQMSGDRVLASPHIQHLRSVASPDVKNALRASDVFRSVINPAEAVAELAYVDLDAFEDQYLQELPAQYRSGVKALRALGISRTPVKSGQFSLVVRLSVNEG
ncbi:DUF3352 domain-containing protein [Dermatophilus congolensis]|uniref:DUF3352 domain-containing protein n=1 Tax=Dermatophilus congolensis TaxID=1863 RepID=UPI001AAF6DEF|nr:DUF3352 domain-containing protein [Dermatophilus congolensis]MBO3130672.1 DUF3352 domain-containing protein [Dermatophilus congolensis]MBO3130698.1 DUF3352 domain-containing protein [Dermatophilus congolensis]MBO3135145.1 DUF3352 domain-containing protein [Dermatophilus congolensis]MBO3137384.1 DUF3352 domain-containing protein [Dermatophilus congolensis]MBO3139625.1 DUF3352 domain-containing protein [Dermatophilus congolensis]